MNYIVLDMEWNQSPNGKDSYVSGVPFEVIQIGAVKLDSKLNKIDEFSAYIKPQIYDKFHKIVAGIIDISFEELLERGREFKDVANEFLEWCQEDYRFVTWGCTDLTELQRNMKYYGVEYEFPQPFLFYDLQKLYSICFSDGKSRITLQHAIEALGIEENEGYHNADSDARYTALVMSKIDMSRVGIYYSVDTFNVPSTRKNEIYLNFGNYGKYISRSFPDKESALEDRAVRSCKCFICNSSMHKHVKWFATNGKLYYGAFECKNHGLIKGKFRVKETDDGKYFALKIFKLTDEDGINQIKERQIKEREHRRRNRKKSTKK